MVKETLPDGVVGSRDIQCSDGTIICDGGVIAMAATVDGRVIISCEGSNVIVEIQPAEELIEPSVLSIEGPPEIILCGSGDIYSAAKK